MALIDTADNRTDGEMMVLHRDARTGQPVYRAVPRPEPGIDEVLVEVHAAGIKVSDCTTWPAPTRPTTSSTSTEFAGRIASFGGGDGEGRFIVGQEVYGLLDRTTSSILADYVVVDTTSIAGRPRQITFAESAAVPSAAVAAWDAIAALGGIKPGETVLLDDGTTDWGVYAIQILTLLGAHAVRSGTPGLL